MQIKVERSDVDEKGRESRNVLGSETALSHLELLHPLSMHAQAIFSPGDTSPVP